MNNHVKKYETVGSCGIDCGLCPRFYTKGNSACPGCGGLNFKEKHPSCGVFSCCAVKNGLEICSECKDYPCKRFEAENVRYDSFVTHQKMFANLEYIRDYGIEQFVENQGIRMKILDDLLSNYDDGRSKSFFCISSALLPLDKLQEAHEFVQKMDSNKALEERTKALKDFLRNIAHALHIELKLKQKIKKNEKVNY